MKSIQTKFITLILGCVLLSSAVIGGVGIWTAQQVVDEDSARIMNLLCVETAQSIDALLSRIEQSVDTLAAYAVGQLESVEKLQTDEGYMAAYTEEIQSVAVNAANNTEGALAVYLRFNPEFGKPTSGLFWSKTTQNGSFQALEPTDLSRYSSEDVEHVGWYYLPVKSGKPIWMAPYLNQNINVEMISYVVPLYKENVTVGVVGIDIDYEVIREIVRSTRVYTSGYAFLVDTQANVMYHSGVPMGTPIDELEDSLVPVAAELKRGENGSYLFSYTWKGETKKLAVCSLQNGMRLAITVPTAEIDAAKNRMIMQSGVALLALAALSVLLTAMTTRRLIRPLKELTEAAKKIAEGDLSIALTHKAKDEVGILAQSFQKTVDHLKQYIDYINGLAYRDGLTGVKNKTAYQEAVARLEDQTRLGRPEFAVVVFDINGLKEVNDTHGHDFGDMPIMNACKIICKVFQHSPVYRIGGDEFVTLLEGEDCRRYNELLTAFRETVDEFNRGARPDARISIARGIACYEEDADLTFGDVFKRADDAMYQNKADMKRRAAKDDG